MNESEALREIRRVARTGLLIFTTHAELRMEQRRVSLPDVRHALRNATTVKRSAPDQASDWTTTGSDVGGDDLTLGIILRGGIIVVTVY
jgi:hypothetical protein